MNSAINPWPERFWGGTVWRRSHHLWLALLLCAGSAAAQDGYWIKTTGSSWANAGNWDAADGIASGTDNTAYFGFGPEAAIASGASFTLDGARTIGNLCFTTQGSAGNWNFSSGSGGPLTLNSTFGLPEITVASPSLQVTLNATLAGNAGVEKDGTGTLILAAQNTYSGHTLVSGGGLNVSGSVGTGGIEVASGTLTGSGIIMGPVVVDSGAALSLGNPSGALTISNSLILHSGSTTYVTVNAATSGHAAVQGLSSITYGGTLMVSNLSGTLSLGQSFSIFGAATASGNFSRILPPPGPWLRWRTDPATGQISVVSSASQPAIANVSVAGTNLIMQVTDGPPGSAGYILSSTDLNQPKSAWTRVATNSFDMSGNFTCTNALNVAGARQTYLAVSVVPSP